MPAKKQEVKTEEVLDEKIGEIKEGEVLDTIASGDSAEQSFALRDAGIRESREMQAQTRLQQAFASLT